MLNLFTSAASLLIGELPEGKVGQQAQRLLEALDYVPAGAISPGAREIDAGTVIAPACSKLPRNLPEFSNSMLRTRPAWSASRPNSIPLSPTPCIGAVRRPASPAWV